MKKNCLIILTFVMFLVNITNAFASQIVDIVWENVSPAFSPEIRASHAMAYDIVNDKVIIYGGFDGISTDYGEVWTYDTKTNTWTNLGASNGPGSRRDMSMVYDSESGKFIMQGGFHNIFYNDTWAYDLNTNLWTNMNPLNSPDLSADYSMAYDSTHDKVIVYAGRKQNGIAINETWEYDYNTNTWTNLNPSVSPLPRGSASQSMVYDEKRDKMILFGGNAWDGVTFLDDTWEYNYATNTWNELNINKGDEITPGERRNAALVYDSDNNETVLYGGFAYSDTWSFNYNDDEWMKISSDTEPDPRIGHTMVYDPNNKGIVLFGGVTDEGLSNETWTGKTQSKKASEPIPEPSTLILLSTALGMIGYGKFKLKSYNKQEI